MAQAGTQLEVNVQEAVVTGNRDEERERLRRQRVRSVAIALGLGFLVILFYAATIVRMEAIIDVTGADHQSQDATAARPKRDEVRRWSNRNVVLSCLAGLAAMGAMTYAAVPLYRLFCQATGYNGTPTRAEKVPDHTVDRVITVRFDANVAPGMPWTFEPVQRTINVKVGESVLAFYRAHNTSDKPVTGEASFNVAPDIAGAYFSKIQCFCFTEQTLAAGESVDMPVSFFIDPAIIKDRDADPVRDIALSYTFYPVAAKSGAKAEVKPGAPRQGG